MRIEAVKSPLCHGGRCDLERVIDVNSIRQAWARQGLDLCAELAASDQIYLWRCRASQLQFYSPAPVGSAKLYEFIAHQQWYYAPNKWEFRKAIEWFQIEQCETVFEIGCGSGEFLKMATARGLNANGIDLNPVAVEAAQALGLHATTDSLEDIQASGVRYRAVCAFQVLEHVVDPLAFIEQAVKLVAPGGHLLFCTPDGDGWLGDRLQLLDVPPHHVTRWGRAAFAFLPRLFPLELQALIPEPLEAHHCGAWAASILDQDPSAEEGRVRIGRRLSAKTRFLVAAMRMIRRRARPSPRDGGQSLMAIFRRPNA